MDKLNAKASLIETLMALAEIGLQTKLDVDHSLAELEL
jgi:hypothetical protein